MQYLLLLNEFQTHKLQWPKWPGWFSFQRPSHAWTSSPNCYICPNPNLLHGSEIRIYCRNLKSNSEILASSGLLLDRAAAELSDLFLWSGYALSLYFNPPSSIAFGRGSCTCPYFAVRSFEFYALKRWICHMLNQLNLVDLIFWMIMVMSVAGMCPIHSLLDSSIGRKRRCSKKPLQH